MSIFDDRVIAKRRGLLSGSISPKSDAPSELFFYSAGSSLQFRSHWVVGRVATGELIFDTSDDPEGSTIGVIRPYPDGSVLTAVNTRIKKYDHSFELEWDREVANRTIRDLSLDPDGFIYMARNRNSSGEPSVLKLTEDGSSVLWDNGASANRNGYNVLYSDGSLFYRQQDYSSRERVWRIDPSTGVPVWATQSRDPGVYAGMSIDLDGNPITGLSVMDGGCALDRETGDVLYTFLTSNPDTAQGYHLSNSNHAIDYPFVGGNNNAWGVPLQHYLLRVDDEDWRVEIDTPANYVAVAGEVVLHSSGDGFITARSVSSGALVWKKEIFKRSLSALSVG